MKFLAVLASATAASAAAVAAPISARQDTTVYPWRTYRRWVQSGELKEDPQDQLLIVKNGNQAQETTTIVSFKFDASTEGKECQLNFKLWADRDHSTGSKQLDVFTYNNLPADTKALAILERDVHVGRISVPLGEEATWEESYHGWPRIPCPAGKTIGVEYVGVGDAVEVRWDIGVSGPTFTVLK